MAAKSKFLRAAIYACAGMLALTWGAALPAVSQENASPRPPARAGRRTTARKQPAPINPFRRQVLTAHPLKVFYYFDDARGFQSLQLHGPGITVLAPQCFSVDGAGQVQGAIPPRVRETANAAHLPVMPLLFNQGFERATASALLHSGAAQERVIRAMADLADRGNVVGFQIDLENIAPADRRLFTLFVKRAAARLHQNGRLLSVAVTPQFSEARSVDHHRGKAVHHQWSGAYDYRALGQYADLITLMTYDHSGRNGPPGPIAGYAWVKTAIKFAVLRVPHEKLLLGLPLYGREWTAGGESAESRSLTFGDVRALIERPEIHVQWDTRWRSPWFEYNDGAAQRTVWYEDSRSLKEKLALMQQYGLRGFAAWRLGDEGPELWPLLAGVKSEQTHGAIRPSRASANVKQKSKIEFHRNRLPESQEKNGGR